MKRRTFLIALSGIAAAAALALAYFVIAFPGTVPWFPVGLREVTEVGPAEEKFQLFADDRIQDKNPVFDPELADRRHLGPADNPWQLNASAAVISLDIKDLRPDIDDRILALRPDFKSAAASLYGVLPSVNAVGAKAKQVDDGAITALHEALAAGTLGPDLDLPGLAAGLLAKARPGGPAAAWLWAGLKTAGRPPSGAEPSGAAAFLAEFEKDRFRSHPLGAYRWSPELEQTWRALAFWMRLFPAGDPAAAELAALLDAHQPLGRRYENILDLLAKTAKPPRRATLRRAGRPDLGAADAYFIAPFDSKETVFFEKAFPQGFPAGDLMTELIKAVREGRVSLEPDSASGWSDLGAYALETLLLPSKGREEAKLLLMKKYKERLAQAFAASLTKHKEAQILMGGASMVGAAGDPEKPPELRLSPPLRVEPNPTYFLRLSRSYSFIRDVLARHAPAALELHGCKEGGRRADRLGDELAAMSRLLYGLYLLSCEDIGLRPEPRPDWAPDAVASETAAVAWLAGWSTDPDLGVDTRVCVPIGTDLGAKETRHWGTFGVRGAKLAGSYARAPRWRANPPDSPAGAPPNPRLLEWHDFPPDKLDEADWLILVDEFGEFSTEPDRYFTREEFRAVLDREGSKDAALRALAR